MPTKEKQSPALPQEDKRPAPRRGKRDEDRSPAQKRRAAAASYRAQRAGRQTAEKQPLRGAGFFRQSLLPMVEHVHRIDQTSLRVGVIWLLILPVLLAVIRRMTDSSKVAFLMIWIVGMFIISAALILIAYADHELKRFLEDAKRYVPELSDVELDELLHTLDAEVGLDREKLAEAREILRGALERRRERRAAGRQDSAEEQQLERRMEEWLRRIELRRGKGENDAEYPTDHSD